MYISIIAAHFVVHVVIGSVYADTTNGVTTLDVERYSHLAKDIKHVFNNKDLEYSGLIHSTLQELYSLNRSDTVLASVQNVLDQKKRLVGKCMEHSKECSKEDVDFVVDHKDEIQLAVSVGRSLLGKRDTNPEKVIEYESHKLSNAKVTIGKSVLNVTVFLDKELQTLRDNLTPYGNAVAIPNEYTGSLTSAN